MERAPPGAGSPRLEDDEAPGLGLEKGSLLGRPFPAMSESPRP